MQWDWNSKPDLWDPKAFPENPASCIVTLIIFHFLGPFTYITGGRTRHIVPITQKEMPVSKRKIKADVAMHICNSSIREAEQKVHHELKVA